MFQTQNANATDLECTISTVCEWFSFLTLSNVLLGGQRPNHFLVFIASWNISKGMEYPLLLLQTPRGQMLMQKSLTTKVYLFTFLEFVSFCWVIYVHPDILKSLPIDLIHLLLVLYCYWEIKVSELFCPKVQSDLCFSSRSLFLSIYLLLFLHFSAFVKVGGSTSQLF